MSGRMLLFLFRRLAAGVGLLLAILPAGLCSCRQRPSDQPSVVRMAIPRQPPSALIFVAQEFGLFDAEGVRIEAVYHSSGKEALAALVRGDADFASTAETPVAIEALTNDGFRVLATIALADNDPRVIGRRDAGIGQPADLRGKRIGTQKASAVHFFLHLFLTKHLVGDDDVAAAFGTADHVVERLVGGELDAICVREPQVTRCVAALGTNAIVFSAPGLYGRREVLVGSVNALRGESKAAKAILRALRAAQKLGRSDPGKASSALARALNTDSQTARSAVREMDLRVGLSHDLLVALEDEAQWAVRMKLGDCSAFPDFLRILYPDPLAGIDPDAVTLSYRPRDQP